MNELVKFDDEHGKQVSISADDVRNMLCNNATDRELALFLELCSRQRLNPFIKDAYLVKYGDKPATMITAKDVFVKRANANPLYEGIEHGIVYMTKQGVQRREGAAVYKAAGEQLIGGWARVYVKGKKPVYAELALDEYSTGRSNWAKMPAVMIDKCAQVAALRLAFPADFQGLYAAEEMGTAGEGVQTGQGVPPITEAAEVVEVETMPRAPLAAEKATAEQLGEVNACCQLLADMRGVEYKQMFDALMNSKAMQALDAVSGVAFTAEQAQAAKLLLEKWIEQAQAKAAEAEIEADYESVEMADEDIEF